MAGNKKSKRVSAGTRPKGIDGKRPTLSIVVNKTRDELDDQNRKMKLIPFVSLQRFRDDQASLWDWETIRFRVHLGHEIAKVLYTEEAISGMHDAILAVNAIKQRCIDSGNTKLRGTAGELHLIQMGMEATDEMQDQLNSKSTLNYFRITEKVISLLPK